MRHSGDPPRRLARPPPRRAAGRHATARPRWRCPPTAL